MRPHQWSPVALLYGIATLGSFLRCTAAIPIGSWVDVLPSLYYIPIVIAAINLGAKATLLVALASGVAHAISSALGCGGSWIVPLTETLLFVCVGLTAAKLTEMRSGLASEPQGASNHEESLEKAFIAATNARQVPAVGQVVDGLIRRFRTPVSSIEGAVWLLEDAGLPEEKHDEFMEIIRKESHQLDRALSDIQQFTRPQKPRFRKVDLAAIVDEVIHLAGRKDGDPSSLFRKEMPSGLEPLMVDREQIRNMLLNLTMNAVQATPAGGQIEIAIRAESESVIITVKDQGRGIPPEIAGRIFDPFFTTRERGLGLGLTVARQIAAAHGGTITVGETSNRGVSVSVSLPLDPLNVHEHGPHTSG